MFGAIRFKLSARVTGCQCFVMVTLSSSTRTASGSAQGKFAEAESMYGRSLAILENTLGPNHPSVAAPLNNMTRALNKQARDVPLLHESLVLGGLFQGDCESCRNASDVHVVPLFMMNYSTTGGYPRPSRNVTGYCSYHGPSRS